MSWTEGDVIRKLRVIYGYTLEELAEISKVSFTTISKMELGKTKEPKRETLRRLAEAFGWTIGQLTAAIPAQPIAVSEAPVLLHRLEREAKRDIKRLSKPQLRRRQNRR